MQDGTESGWQAKHVEGIDPLLAAMTDSVKRVAKERPELRNLTVAISWNLAIGTRHAVAAEWCRLIPDGSFPCRLETKPNGRRYLLKGCSGT